MGSGTIDEGLQHLGFDAHNFWVFRFDLRDHLSYASPGQLLLVVRDIKCQADTMQILHRICLIIIIIDF